MDERKIEDSILKLASEMFAEQLVPYFGIQAKVVSAVPTELVTLNISRQYMDYSFETEDEIIRHFEFQSTDVDEDDLVRFHAYESVLSLKTGKKVITYVIFSGDIKNPRSEYNAGLYTYRLNAISLCHKDAVAVLERLSAKLKRNEPLAKEDMLELTLLPLMGGNINRKEKIKQALVIAKDSPVDNFTDSERTQVQAMLYAFAEKFLDGSDLHDIREVIHMTRLGQMIFDDGMKAGAERGQETKLIQQVCRKLSKGKDIYVIADELEEDPTVITRICQAAEEFAPDYDCELIYQKLNA